MPARLALADNAGMSRHAPALQEGDLAEVLGYQMTRAVLVLEQAYETSAGSSTGLHRVEYTVLAFVKANAGCTAAVLARTLGVSTPNMALWLDRLSGKGLLARRPSATDRRANHLHLTREGGDMLRQATAAIAKAENDALAGLSPGERVLLGELLRKIAAAKLAAG